MSTTDEMTLAQARRGDQAAFEALVTPHEQMLWRVCWRTLGDAEEARDALQETMLKAWRNLANFSGGGLVSWLYTIAVHTCQDMLRKRKVRPAVSLDGMAEEGYDPPDREEGPAEALERKDNREAVRKALGMLPEDQRVPLVLFAVEGKRYEDIAAITGMPVGTVKSRVSRARDRLRVLLAEMQRDGNNSGGPASKSVKGGRKA